MGTALITGVAGFCGHHLAQRLGQDPATRVVGLDLAARPPAVTPVADYVSADMSDFGTVSQILERFLPERIFHLAGAFRGSPAVIYGSNLLAGVQLLEAVRQVVPAARVLLVGSAAEYGAVAASELPVREDCPCRPASPYAVSKLALTLAAQGYAREHQLRVTVARVFNVVGAGIPESLVLGAVLRRLKAVLARGAVSTVPVGNLDNRRDFLAIEDVVDAFVRLLEGDWWGEVFNICSGEAWSIRRLLDQLLASVPSRIRLEVDPALVRINDVPVMYGSWDKAHRTFGFVPRTPVADGVRAAWESVMGDPAGCDS